MNKNLFFFLFILLLLGACQKDNELSERSILTEQAMLLSNQDAFQNLLTFKRTILEKRISFINSATEKQIKETPFYKSIGYETNVLFQDYLLNNYLPILQEVLNSNNSLRELNKDDFIFVWRSAAEFAGKQRDLVDSRICCQCVYINCLNDAWDYYDLETDLCLLDYLIGGDGDLYAYCLGVAFGNWEFAVAICDDGWVACN